MANRLPQTISREAAANMLNSINTKRNTGKRNYAMVVMMYRAGLRVSEICNLGLSDVNFQTGFIFVQHGKNDKDRYVPMDDDIRKACREWLKFHPGGDWFFCAMNQNQLITRQVREVCYTASKNAGVYITDGKHKSNVSPHKLRHTYATELIEEGEVNLREAQELLGHSDPSTTTIYTHVSPQAVKKKITRRKKISEGFSTEDINDDFLKPCPICGGKVQISGGTEDWKPSFNDPDSGGDPYYIHCSCGIQFSIGYCDASDIAGAWNRRM